MNVTVLHQRFRDVCVRVIVVVDQVKHGGKSIKLLAMYMLAPVVGPVTLWVVQAFHYGAGAVAAVTTGGRRKLWNGGVVRAT